MKPLNVVVPGVEFFVDTHQVALAPGRWCAGAVGIAMDINRNHRRAHQLREWVEYPWAAGVAYFGPPRQPDDQPTSWEATCKRCGRSSEIRADPAGTLRISGEALSQSCTTTK